MIAALWLLLALAVVGAILYLFDKPTKDECTSQEHACAECQSQDSCALKDLLPPKGNKKAQ